MLHHGAVQGLVVHNGGSMMDDVYQLIHPPNPTRVNAGQYSNVYYFPFNTVTIDSDPPAVG